MEEEPRFETAMEEEQPGPCQLFVLTARTLNGRELQVEGLTANTLLTVVWQELARQLGTIPSTIKLLAETESLTRTQTLSEAGLAEFDASVEVIRCPASEVEIACLFRHFRHACSGKQVQEAKRLIDMGAGFTTTTGCTLLHVAILEGLKDLALYAIGRMHGNLENKNDCGQTALLLALATNQIKVAEALLDQGANPDATDQSGHSALQHALQQGQDSLAARLVRSFRSPGHSHRTSEAFRHVAPWPDGCLVDMGAEEASPVLLCCMLGLPLTALAVLELGGAMSTIGGPDSHGRTALHFAYGQGLHDVVEALLAQGAAEDAQDASGRPPHQGTATCS